MLTGCTLVFAQNEALMNYEDPNGLRQGTWIEYNNQGSIKTLKTYLNSKLHGVSLTFFPQRNGLKSQEYYSNSQYHGKQTYYDQGGRITKTMEFNNGTLNGKVVSYYNTKKEERRTYLSQRD